MSPTKTIIDPSHELTAAPNLPEIEAGYEYPELSGYEGYLTELDNQLYRHGKMDS